MPTRRTIQALTALVPVLIVFLMLSCCAVFEPLDRLWLDLLFESYPLPVVQDKRIVTVFITDQSLRSLNISYPLPRRCFTRAIEILHRLGAKAIAFNFVVGESIYGDEEDELIDVSRKLGNVVFAVNAVRKGDALSVEEPFGGRTSGLNLAHNDIVRMRGAARYLDARIGRGDAPYMALPFKVLGIYENKEVRFSRALAQESLTDPRVRRSGDGERPWYIAPGTTVRVGERTYPLWGDRLIMNYSRYRQDLLFPSLSFEDLFFGNPAPGLLKNKAVIIGTKDMLLHDTFRVPLRSSRGLVFGTYLQAFALKMLMDGTLLSPLSPIVLMGLLVVLASCMSVVCVRVKPVKSLMLLIGIEAALVGSSIALYHRSIVLPVCAPGLAALATWLITIVQRSGEMQRELTVDMKFMEGVNRAGLGREGSAGWLGQLLTLTCSIVGAHAGWILIRHAHGESSLAATWHTESPAASKDLEGGLCGKALATGKYILTLDLQRERIISPFEAQQRITSLLCFPLLGSSRPLGIIALGKKFPGRFTAEHLRHLMTIGTLSGALLENVQLSGRIQELFIDAISSLANAIDARDPYTYGHSTRVARFSGLLARSMGLSGEEVRQLEIAGILHDIGKIGVPEAILQKPSKLTDDEFTVMKKHPEIAVEILKPLNELYALLPIIASHHEKRDGTGYPRGLREDEIPLYAKILAVADIYDALTSERPYRSPSSAREGLAIMRTHFADHIEERFIDCFESVIQEIGERSGESH